MINATPALVTATELHEFQAAHSGDNADFAEKLAILQREGADINTRDSAGVTVQDRARNHDRGLLAVVRDTLK